MKADLELFFAVASALLGLSTAVCAMRGKPDQAAMLGGIGLFVCNVIWVLRLT